VILRDNTVYSHPGGGINALFADRVTIENNRVSNVAAYSPYGASAINIYRAKDVDSDTSSYKMVIRGNVASEAQNLFPCRCVSYSKQTDGNGVILDQLNNATTTTFTTAQGVNPPIPPGTYSMPAYAGRTLIANNIVTKNGARGIHVFQSANADIFYNTAYQNSLIAVTGDGEISAQNSRKVRAYNNIMVARSDRPTHWIAFANATAKAADGATVDFNQNLLFGGDAAAAQVQVTTSQGALGANNRLGLDPRFATLVGPFAFSLFANSPAVDSAWIGGTVAAPATDVYLAPRPRGAWADVGAVESF
jgi:parallel beta-helix repeat protein